MLLISLFFVGLFVGRGFSITCTVNSPCKATCNETISLDISQLFSYPYKITLDSSLESPGKYFLFIPCDGQKCTSSDDFLSSVCLAITDTELSSCGQSTSNFVTWELLSTNPYQFWIAYTGGDCKGTDCQQSNFTFLEVADASSTTIEYVDYFDNYYTFQVTGKCIGQAASGCKFIANKKKNIDGNIGLVLIFLFIIGIATYFIVGIIVMKFYKGAKGAELIPNYEFWSDLPFLIKDGCLFTISPCYKRNSDYKSLN